MFDAQTRIVVCNVRYLEMYKLSPDIVKPGCTLRELIEHRKATGLLTGDVEDYCKRIVDSVRERKNKGFYVPAADGRAVFAPNEALPAGGWV